VRREYLPCRAIGVGVGFSAERDRPRVTATGSQNQGNAGATRRHKDPAVTFDESLMSEREPSEYVRRQGIDAGLVEDDVGPEGKSSRQDLVKMAQVGVVFNAIGQSHIQAALFLAEGKVAGAVDGEGEDAGIVLKYLRRSVTLMDIEVDHGGAANEAAFPQEMNCHGDIVEHTEAGTF